MNQTIVALVATILPAMFSIPVLGQTGACCQSNGICSIVDATTCTTAGGDFQGEGEPCFAGRCKGGCCRPTGECTLNIGKLFCETNGGTYLGHMSDCLDDSGNDIVCPILPNGACCRRGSSCQEGFTEDSCDGGRFWAGDGSTCADCPGPCCLSGGECIPSTRGQCEVDEGGEFGGHSFECPVDGCGEGACCLASVEEGGNCGGPVNPFDCELSRGRYQGHGTDCATTTCPLFGGGCCCGGFSCFVTTVEECDLFGCAFLGEGVACGATGECPGTGACCVDGACTETNGFDCIQSGGAYSGEGTTCDTNPCVSDSIGACCYVISRSTFCSEIDDPSCQEKGGHFRGVGTRCNQLDPPCNGACCTGGSHCRDRTTPEECTLDTEEFLGMGTTCATVACGACCYEDGSCLQSIRFTECLDSGGMYRSPGVCEGDTDGDGIDDACKSGACCFESTGGFETTCENGHTRGTCGGRYVGDDTICLGDDDESGVDDVCERCQSDEDCFDAVFCTDDICDLKSGECRNVPNDTFCLDETACTVNERCDPLLGCVLESLDCNDDIPCTIDTCDPVVGCLNGADHTRCDDSNACTTDLCRPLDPERDATGCIHTSTDCDDGVDCTNDACDPATGDCHNEPDDANCEFDGCSVRSCDLHEGCVELDYVCGACCTVDRFIIIDCVDTTQANCEASENLFRGAGTTCANLDPPCMGACCLDGIGCAQTTREECEDHSGEWYGHGSSCQEVDCGACCVPGIGCIQGWKSEFCALPDPAQPDLRGTFFPQQLCDEVPCGACCDQSAQCGDGTLASDCVEPGQEFRGTGSRCSGLIDGNCGDAATCLNDDHCRTAAPDACHQRERCVEGVCVPSEPIACDDGDDCTVDTCDPDLGCQNVQIEGCCATDADCEDGDPCTEHVCDPQLGCVLTANVCGACCRVGEPCIDGVAENQCAGAFDTFLGIGSRCDTASCGACCETDTGECSDGITAAECTAADRAFQGAGTTCALDPCLGACCLPDGTCANTTGDACAGVFRGIGTSCGELNPPCEPFGGACCLDGGLCVQATPEACDGVHAGRYQGDSTQCNDIDCATTGACCLSDGDCVQSTEAGCFDGTFQGPGTTCTDACQGACCRSDGSCTVGAAGHCAGDFRGVGISCDELNPACVPFVGGACCLTSDTCIDGTTAVTCGAFLDGRHQGDATRCDDVDCASTGACCLADGACVQATAAGCFDGTFQGAGTDCPDGCDPPGDVNGDGSVDLRDGRAMAVFFGQAVGPGHPGEKADLNGDGQVGLVDVALFVPFMTGPR